MKRIRILHVLTTNKFGGAESVAMTIINSMSDEYEVVYTSPEGDINNALNNRNIDFYPLKKFNYFELKKVVNIYQPDIIHAHDFKASVMSSLFKTKKISVISHIHHVPSWFNKINLRTILFQISLFRIKKVISVTKDTLELYPFRNRLKKKLSVFGNPIDSTIIKSLSEGYCSEDYFSDIIFVGRLSEEKRPFLFVEIIKDIVPIIPNLKVNIIGDGPLKDEMNYLLKEYNLDKNIQVLGFIENPYPYIKNSRLLVSTSKREGFGLSIVEALILQTPVVTFRLPGLERFIKDMNSIMVDTREDMILEISNMLLHQEYYDKIIAELIEFSDKLDNKVSYMNKIREVYRGVLE